MMSFIGIPSFLPDNVKIMVHRHLFCTLIQRSRQMRKEFPERDEFNGIPLGIVTRISPAAYAQHGARQHFPNCRKAIQNISHVFFSFVFTCYQLTELSIVENVEASPSGPSGTQGSREAHNLCILFSDCRLFCLTSLILLGCTVTPDIRSTASTHYAPFTRAYLNNAWHYLAKLIFISFTQPSSLASGAVLISLWRRRRHHNKTSSELYYPSVSMKIIIYADVDDTHVFCREASVFRYTRSSECNS